MSASPAVNNLMSKAALLAMPGTHSQSLYASLENQTVELIQSSTLVGRFTNSLNNLQFGGSSQVVVPSNSMLSSMWLELVLTLPRYTFVNDGWGLNAIASVSYIWGSSSTSQLTIQTHSIITSILNGCETAEQRTEHLFQAGGATQAPDAPVTVTASVLLPFPWSTSAKNGTEQFPFDLSLLSGGQPIIIRIDFAPTAANFMGGGPSFLAAATKFDSATIVFVNVEMADQANSLSNVIRQDPSMVSAFPFRHLQSFLSSNFVSPDGTVSGTFGGPGSPLISIPLTSFLRSDLTAITFSLLNVANNTGTVARAGGYRPLDFIDLNLEYNGVSLMRCPNLSYQAPWVSSRGSVGAGYFEQEENTSFAFTTPPTTQFYYLANYTAPRNGMKSAFRSGTDIASVSRYPNQILTLNFRVPLTAVATTYVVAVTYTYQAIVETSQAGVSIIFN
jgi:hypothetical protein